MNELENKVKKKKHNGIISFWKFMFSIMIVIFHSENLAFNTDYILFKDGAIAVEFFFIVSRISND